MVPWGILLPIAVGAIAMSASTIIVATNAQTLRRLKLRPDEPTPPDEPTAGESHVQAAQA